MAPIFGGTPGFKRKRGIYRALERKDPEVLSRYHAELNLLAMMSALETTLFWGAAPGDGEGTDD